MELLSTALGPDTIGSVRTASYSIGSKAVHALPNFSTTKIALCGLDCSKGWAGDGMYGHEREITCRNCIRVARATPHIIIRVETSVESGYAPNHDDCAHRSDSCLDMCSDCIVGQGCDNCRSGSCECESLGDEECDSVGGRWLEGDTHYHKSSQELFPFDRELFDELNGNPQDYVKETLDNPCLTSGMLRGVDWRRSHDMLPIAIGRDDDYQGDEYGAYTRYSVHLEGPGVTPRLRDQILHYLTGGREA